MYQQPQETQPNLGRGAHLLNAVFVGVVSSAAAAAVVWLFVFGGIGSITDKIGRAEFSSLPPWVTIGNPHQDVADSAVLTLADMPPGWVLSVDDDDDSDDSDADFELSEECKQFEGQEPFEGAQSSSTSKEMDGVNRQSVSSDAHVFASSEAAQAALEAHRNLFSQCGNDLAAIFDAVLKEGLAEEGIPPDQLDIQTVLEDLGSPNAGESGVMFRIHGTVTGPGGSFEYAIDFMAFRHGRMVGELSYSSFAGLPPAEEQQVAQIAAAKLQTANASFNSAN